jgi:hypothetical protein
MLKEDLLQRVSIEAVIMALEAHLTSTGNPHGIVFG